MYTLKGASECKTLQETLNSHFCVGYCIESSDPPWGCKNMKLSTIQVQVDEICVEKA